MSDEKAQYSGFKEREVKVGWYENGTEKNYLGRNPLFYRGWRLSQYHSSSGYSEAAL